MAGGLLTATIIDRVPGPVVSREELRAAVREGRAPNIFRAGAIDQLRRMQGPITANAPADAASALMNDQMARTVAESAAQAQAQADAVNAAAHENATAFRLPGGNMLWIYGGIGIAVLGAGYLLLRK